MTTQYDLHMDDKFGKLNLIDIPKEVLECPSRWFNQTLTTVNDAVVRLGIFTGEFHWHKHDEQDEFFLTLEGEFFIEVQGKGTIRLGKHQGYTIPAGVMHRPYSPQQSVVLMVERAGIVPTGD